MAFVGADARGHCPKSVTSGRPSIWRVSRAPRMGSGGRPLSIRSAGTSRTETDRHREDEEVSEWQ
jgi:hypothetical protein